MKLTVGPLPASVYWRRRAIVFGVVVVAVLTLWVSCSPPPERQTNEAANRAAATTSASADEARNRLPGPAPTASPTVLVPGTPGPAPAEPGPASSAPQPIDPAVPPCTDEELSLVAAPEATVAYRGAYLKLYLRIKNTSARDCVRDVGADFQELYLQSTQVGDVTKMWSSDACEAPKGGELRVLKPGIEVEYSITWNGRTSDKGCADRQVPPHGKYQLIARLGNKLSEPVQIQLN